MQLSPVAQKYVLHWGEMGTRWGVNRTVAQIQALLFLADRPLCAEEITETLGVARANVSTSLKELQAWGLVKPASILGDRREHFVALQDVWAVFRVIMEGRKGREIDPTLSVLRDCVLEADTDTDLPTGAKQRMQEALAFMEALTGWYDQMKKLPQPVLTKLLKMGAKIQKLLG